MQSVATCIADFCNVLGEVTLLLLLALADHDVEDLFVGFVHGVGTDADEVAYALVNVVVDDAFDAAHAVALHGKHGREHCGAHARSEFESARGFCSVADHAGEVGNHVLNGSTDLFVSATHEIGDATAGTC